MPRTALPIETLPGATPLTAEALTWTAADVANGNRFTITGREVIYARNVGASTRTVTMQTVAVNGRQDPLHNTAQNITAGQYLAWGPIPTKGFKQTDGEFYLSANHAEVEFMIVRQPTS